MRRYPVIAPNVKQHPARIEATPDNLWTPDLLGDVLVAWYDILNEKNPDLEYDGLKVWHDKTGNGNHIYQDNHELQPTWVEHAFSNSKEGVVYDGFNDRMSGTTLSVPQPFTVAQIIKTGQDQHEYGAIFGGAAQDAVIYIRNEDVDGEIAMKAGNLEGNTVGSGIKVEKDKIYIMITQFDEDDSSISLNSQRIEMPGVGTFGITSGPNM